MNPTRKEVVDARKRAGMTQPAAADLVGISLRAWQTYEYGERKMPEPTWRLFRLLTERVR